MSELQASMANPAPPLMARLKSETSAEHEALEEALPLMGPLCTLEQYRTYLERMYGFLKPLETAVWSYSEWALGGLDSEVRTKVPALRADLEALRVDCDALPSPTGLRALTRTFADAMGVAYVLEGATLGGQIIARQLKRRLGIDGDHGARFLLVYGTDVGRRWNEFRAFGESWGSRVDERELDVAVDAARLTFAAIHAWLGGLS